jgi:hypothetical protein
MRDVAWRGITALVRVRAGTDLEAKGKVSAASEQCLHNLIASTAAIVDGGIQGTAESFTIPHTT